MQCRQLNALEAARKELACRLEVQTAELSEKDARLSHITALLDHAREVLAAKQRYHFAYLLVSQDAFAENAPHHQSTDIEQKSFNNYSCLLRLAESTMKRLIN